MHVSIFPTVKKKHIPTLEECAELHPGKAIEAYMEYAEKNTEELAEALAINPDDLEAIIRGDADLTRDLMRKLSKITKTRLDQWTDIQKREKALAEATMLDAM